MYKARFEPAPADELDAMYEACRVPARFCLLEARSRYILLITRRVGRVAAASVWMGACLVDKQTLSAPFLYFVGRECRGPPTPYSVVFQIQLCSVK